MNKNLVKTILLAVALGVGVGAGVLSVMGKMEASNGILLLSIGVVCLAIVQLQEK